MLQKYFYSFRKMIDILSEYNKSTCSILQICKKYVSRHIHIHNISNVINGDYSNFLSLFKLCIP